MCGIFALINNDDEKYSKQIIYNEFMKGQNRGPENMQFMPTLDLYNCKHTSVGFHRLAINGLDEISNQPIVIDDIMLICNGEIYNYNKLLKSIDIDPVTHSDCEIIIHLYKKYGILHTVSLLDGVFAFVLFDFSHSRITGSFTMFAGRDTFGVRPLFILEKSTGMIGFASELKQLSNFYESSNNDKLCQFKPGTVSGYELDIKKNHIIKHLLFPFKNNISLQLYESHLNGYLHRIRTTLRAAVKKRVENTDRPIACLLSGGLDSSLITALVAECVPDVAQLETFSIGLEGGSDLAYAKKVADHLGTKHTEIVASSEDFLKAIPEVIFAIESYDTTTVRASVGNYLIGKYIKEHSDAKVIFNGDGSDELSGGYLYMHYCKDDYEYDKECRRLLRDIHYFDVLRSDRCISCHGLEARTPFLDTQFVQAYLSIPREVRNHNNHYCCNKLERHVEKYLIRSAFDKTFVTEYLGSKEILPNEVLWRRKEAFSDGVSKNNHSWYSIINNNISALAASITTINPTLTLEQNYYKTIFKEFFGDVEHVIPYYWMPKYCEATDCSARELSIY